jgi:phosphoglycerate kinase
MKLKTIDDFDFKGKKVLLRVDLNSEIINKKIILSERIIEHSKTIKELLKKGAKVIVISHQGRPGSSDFISLEKHSKIINKFVKIKFVKDIIGNKAIKAIRELNNGEAILLENLRFLKEELNPSKNNKLAEILSKEVDFYINDALSISHREQTSVVVFPKLLPHCIGRVMEKELENINKLDLKDTLFILGGVKIEDLMLLIEKKKIISGGTFALLGLVASGLNLGLENKLLKNDLTYVKEIKKNLKNIILPIDLAIDFKGKRQNVSLYEFPNKYKVLDIGNETINLYEKEIKKAKTIFIKGPMGYCEKEEFSLGTKKILKCVEESGAFCVMAGGHTSNILKRLKINKNKIGYISLSGGALLHIVAGKKLPGIEALKD